MAYASCPKQFVAQSVAGKFGIAQAYGEIMPDKKFEMLEQLQESGHHVAMIGDGVNDSLNRLRMSINQNAYLYLMLKSLKQALAELSR